MQLSHSLRYGLKSSRLVQIRFSNRTNLDSLYAVRARPLALECRQTPEIRRFHKVMGAFRPLQDTRR
jgi:hypothetical protein